MADEHLPIDAYADEIAATIERHRVTIIHGETGCGKSSRLPAILDAAATAAGRRPVRMMISQPRRIAARMLAERMRTSSQLGDAVGYRMGHGAREESRSTRVWYCTAGYLARLLAHHPEAFDAHSHLVIDEVHERSIDSDILCLLARRLLRAHPTIRVVLMSATIAAEQFRDYFADGGEEAPPILFVGARRFPVGVFYASSPSLQALLGQADRQTAARIAEGTRRAPSPSTFVTRLQHELAVSLASTLAQAESSVLIFVAGMSDIEEIAERFDAINQRDPARRGLRTFVVVPVHSDIPHEEQLALLRGGSGGGGSGGGAAVADGSGGEWGGLAGAAAAAAEAEEHDGCARVRVIVATNAAESSVTLPDVDVVVCLGAVKQVGYNAATHRQRLELTWISRASATQRAGRTGRLRPGSVYRLYHEELHDERFEPFERAELTRMPLDSVIVSLRTMLGGGPVVPTLLETVEPPDVRQIDKSFTSLHAARLLSEPSDEGELTAMGSFVAALGTDLAIGRMVGLGAQLGVLPEAIALGAALSLPTPPFAQANPLVHPPAQYNGLVKASLVSQAELDEGCYCEPLACARLLYQWRQCGADAGAQRRLLARTRVNGARVRMLAGLFASLTERVASHLAIDRPQLPDPRAMRRGKLTVLRLLQVWVFPTQLVVSRPLGAKLRQLAKHARPEALPPPAGGAGGAPAAIGLQVTGSQVERSTLEPLLPPGCCFGLSGGVVYEYVTPASKPPARAAREEALREGAPLSLRARLRQLRERTRADALLVLCVLGPADGVLPTLHLELKVEDARGACAPALAEAFGAEAVKAACARAQRGQRENGGGGGGGGQGGLVSLAIEPSSPRRGERRGEHRGSDESGSSGADSDDEASDEEARPSAHERAALAVARAYKRVRAAVQGLVSITCLLNAEGALLVATGGVQLDDETLCAAVGGEACRPPSAGQQKGAAARPEFKSRTHALKQVLTMAADAAPPGGAGRARPPPLVQDLPLGARVLGQVAAGYRKEDVIKLPAAGAGAGAGAGERDGGTPARGGARRAPRRGAGADDDAARAEPDGGAVRTLKVDVPRPRWTILPPSGRRSAPTAFMPHHSVAAAVAAAGDKPLVAVAATMLDLAGGGARCSGVTLLEPGGAFAAKALLAFGLDPTELLLALGADEAEDGPLVGDEEALAAIDFDARCRALGEDLSCSVEAVEAVQALFHVPRAEWYEPFDVQAEQVVMPTAGARGGRRRVLLAQRAERLLGIEAPPTTVRPK